MCSGERKLIVVLLCKSLWITNLVCAVVTLQSLKCKSTEKCVGQNHTTFSSKCRVNLRDSNKKISGNTFKSTNFKISLRSYWEVIQNTIKLILFVVYIINLQFQMKQVQHFEVNCCHCFCLNQQNLYEQIQCLLDLLTEESAQGPDQGLSEFF